MATDPKYGYRITLEKGQFSDGTEYFTAVAPELPDCLFQADTPHAAEVGLYEVIDHLISLMRERGKEPPPPILAEYATVGSFLTTSFGFGLPADSSATPSPDSPSRGTDDTQILVKRGELLVPA